MNPYQYSMGSPADNIGQVIFIQYNIHVIMKSSLPIVPTKTGFIERRKAHRSHIKT
jgi:hypothetical protein